MPRTHLDMLQLCCGVCGVKKKPEQLHKITPNLLSKLHQMNGYADYDLEDDRYPKVICSAHKSAIHEKLRNPNQEKYKNYLPEQVPDFKSIALPHKATRTTPTGYNEDHTCILCDQNIVGRPREMKTSSSHESVCATCFQKTGRGIDHPCKKSIKQSVASISNSLQSMDTEVQDKVIHKVIKSKLDPNKGDKTQQIKLHTAAKSSNLVINPSKDRKCRTIPENTMDQIRSQAGLSLNQTKIVAGGIRSSLGKKSIAPNYRDHASGSLHLLDEFYKYEMQDFSIENKSESSASFKSVWTVWAPLNPLIHFVNNKRNLPSTSDYLIKIMGDSGQGKTKICFCIIPFNESTSTKKRSTYLEGGALAKGFNYSGVNKCIMCFCAPEIKETHGNLEKIFTLIEIDAVFSEHSKVIFTGDLKFLNEVYGLMEASSRHNCIYCTAPAQSLEASQPRTLGTLRKDYENWSNGTGANKKCGKNFNNVKNYPLFKRLPDSTPTLKLSPPPTLHILLGIFNHIWKNIESMSTDHEKVLQDFAISNNCMKESYWGKTFEGNECAKLMNRISTSDTPLSNLSGVENHITAIKAFNEVRNNVFGTELKSGWKESLKNFRKSYSTIKNISRPLKVHILSCHVEDFVNEYSNGKGLGFYSEQTGESIHAKFEPCFNNYKMKNKDSLKYGKRLMNAVVEFSSMHV